MEHQNNNQQGLVHKEATSSPTTKEVPMMRQQQTYLKLRQDLTLLEGLEQSEKKVVSIWVQAKKFREFNNDDYQKFCFWLLRKCADLGITKPPLPQEIINWSVSIGKSYPNLSIEDLDLAFELSLTGQLNFESGDQWKTVTLDKFIWETFLTINKLCSGYVQYQRGKMKTYNRRMNNKISEIQAKEQDEKIWREYVRNWKISLYNAYSEFHTEGTFELVDEYCSYFRQLRQSGNLSLTDFDIEGIRYLVSQEHPDQEKLMEESRLCGFTASDIIGSDAFRVTEYMIECCTMAIKTQFEIWKESKANVAHIIRSMQLKKITN